MAKRGPKGPSKYTQAFIEAQAEALIYYAEKASKPTEQEYAYTQSLDTKRFSEWANPENPAYSEKFSEALKKFKNIQYYKWLTLAADGNIPPAVFIFFAKNAMGMRDEQHIKGEGLAPVLQLIVPREGTRNRLTESNA